MAKEHFFYPASRSLFQKLEQLSQRSGVSRGQAFEDWLTAMVSALAAETKEDEYLAMISRHTSGKPGKRGADLMPEMFADLVNAMSTDEDLDVLGDLFQGAITYGEAGQYFTPAPITELMARLSVDPDAKPTRDEPIYVHDPCCGTGRMLLAASQLNPHVECVGVDIDARCVKITSINLGLRSRYGWVVCGNALSGETQFAYRIGSFFHESPNGHRRGVIRDVPPEDTPVPVIAERLRTRAGDLFAESQGDDVSDKEAGSSPAFPTIIEVPDWLARLEPRLAALDREEPPVADEQPPVEVVPSEQTSPKPDNPQPKQGELF